MFSEWLWCFSSYSPASLPTATVRKCWTASSSVGSWLLRRYAPHPRCQHPGLLVLPSTCKPVSTSLGLSESCQFACVAKVLFTHPASTFLCELGYLAQVALGILLGFPDLLLPAGPGPGLRVVELIPAQPYQVPVTLPNS